MNKIKLAVIGAGKFGRNYIKIIQQSEMATLACVVSSNPETATIVSDEVRIMGDWSALMHSALVDGVIIATPPRTHADISIAALKAGIPVLCEKPLALSSADTSRIGAYIGFESIFHVDHIHLFNPAYRAIKSSLKLLGKIQKIESCGGNNGPFRNDVSAYWDYGAHDVSMMLDLFGDFDWEPKNAMRFEDEISPDSEQENAGTFMLEFAHRTGVMAYLKFGNTMRNKQRWLRITGEKGVLTYDDLQQDKVVFTSTSGEMQNILYNHRAPLDIVVERFCKAINIDSSATVSDFHFSREVVRVLEFSKFML